MRTGSLLLGIACALLLSLGAAGASPVTFDVTGKDIVSGSTWTVDTTTGLVPNGGLPGSDNITVTGYPLFQTDNSAFFFHFTVFGTEDIPYLDIPSFSTSAFVSFAGGTFTGEVCGGPYCDTVLLSNVSMTFTPISATPLP